jgi:hypothetical protein
MADVAIKRFMISYKNLNQYLLGEFFFTRGEILFELGD